VSKQIVKATFIFVLFVLAFTALDDITTGNEPTLAGEYLLIWIIFPMFGYLLGNFWLYLAKITNKKIARLARIGGYHFHHSTLGVIMIVLAFFLQPLWLRIVVAGLGLGIFIHHLVTEKFVFITKD
jgi:hypothetical protein